MTDQPVALSSELAALFAEVDAAFEDWCHSTEQLHTMAREVIALADSIDTGLADAKAELMEWF